MNIKRTLEWTIDTDQTLQTYADQFGEQVEEFTARLIQERLLSMLEEDPGLSVTQSITMEELKAISYETLIQHPKNDVAVEVDTSSLGSWHTEWPATHGLTNFFPILLNARVLMSLATQQGSPWVAYDLYVKKAYEIGKKLKKHLIVDELYKGEHGLYERGLTDGLPWIPYEDQMEGRRRTSRRTQTRHSIRLQRSYDSYHRRYSSAKTGGSSPGAMVQLGMVIRKGKNSTMRRCPEYIALTGEGYEFALQSYNPIIDKVVARAPPKLIKTSMSSDERQYVIELLKKHMPLEWGKIQAVLQHIPAEGVVPRSVILTGVEKLEDEIGMRIKRAFGASMTLSRILARMVDVGLVRREERGREVLYGRQ